MEKYYTGIGSRNTPKKILDMMRMSSIILAKKGYILRSGGACGADSTFESGCDSVNGQKQIFLPWLEYNGRQGIVYQETPEYLQIVKDNHPNYRALSNGAKKLIGRNYLELVGLDNVKSEFVICYDPGEGGTNYTHKLANKLGIKVYNLFEPEIQKSLETFINENNSI